MATGLWSKSYNGYRLSGGISSVITIPNVIRGYMQCADKCSRLKITDPFDVYKPPRVPDRFIWSTKSKACTCLRVSKGGSKWCKNNEYVTGWFVACISCVI